MQEVNMPRYSVSYSTSVEFTVEIDAESAEAAEDAVVANGKDADGVYDWEEEGYGGVNTVHSVEEME
jgi:hypothetical protein